MYSYGTGSRNNLSTCVPELQDIMNEVIKIIDASILCGHRDEEGQCKAVEDGASEKEWPDSTHNELPSKAVDIVPYPIDWDDIPRFAQLGGIIKGIALMKGYKIRCGFDWDGDGDIRDQKFMDWPHIEYLGRI